VLERTTGPDGKGELLDWYLRGHPLAADEAMVVLDADNRVEGDFLSRLSAELGSGCSVVQASVLPSNMNASPIASAAGLGDWMAREMIYKRAAARGWPVELGGTGFCATGEALRAAGGWSGSLTEDLDLTIRLILAGQTIKYLSEATVWDEKPIDLRTAVGQRRRWARGRTGVRKRRAQRLLRASWAGRSIAMTSLALRLVLPGRSFRLLVTLALGGLSLAWDWSFPFSWTMWAAIAMWLGGRPLWTLWRVREVRPYLHWYPLTLIWGFVWVWVRIVPSRGGWYHTPHRGRV
jgi:cellulose synthase/poly-beta-1,6-N-acetylglucosamine synthase-like glycosyltransferase